MPAPRLHVSTEAVTMENMKSLLLGFTGCFLLGGSLLLHAQTNAATADTPPSPQLARASAMLSFLTPAEQIQYAKARAKALADNPDLKAEGESVAQEGIQAMSADATAADRQAFIEKMNSHRQKLRQAMLKEDATLEPIFEKIDKHISEMKAKQLDHVQSSLSPTNPATTGPSDH
jgi:hypothetical protein